MERRATTKEELHEQRNFSFESCIVSEDTRIIWIPNGRSAQASVRSANRTTSSSSTVASARLSVLDTSALSRTLERAREYGRK